MRTRGKEQGTDVVVGVAQTYGRPRTTEMLNGLEAIPPRILTYQDRTFEELGVETLIKRHPERALIDELGHTNIPGSRRAKRWEDVLDILAEGIAVITTLNIQHLASLNDLVARITGIRQQETVRTGCSILPTRWSWSTCRPMPCGDAWRTATSTPTPTRPSWHSRSTSPRTT